MDKKKSDNKFSEESLLDDDEDTLTEDVLISKARAFEKKYKEETEQNKILKKKLTQFKNKIDELKKINDINHEKICLLEKKLKSRT